MMDLQDIDALTIGLHDAIAEVAPIAGVSIGDWSDKQTWRVDYSASATGEQKAAAQSVIASFNPVAVRPDQINKERDRRIAGGFRFGEHLYDSDDKSRTMIAEAGMRAMVAIISGAQTGDLRWDGDSEDFYWIAADNQKVAMDAQTTVDLAAACQEHVKRHNWKARALKDQSPIPANYQADEHWT